MTADPGLRYTQGHGVLPAREAPETVAGDLASWPDALRWIRRSAIDEERASDMAGARPKATPVRRDPDRRRTQAGHDPTALERSDPSKKYKWVHPDDRRSAFGVRGHEQRGWGIEMASQGGVIPQRGACSAVGQPVEMDGYVLMSIAREAFQRAEDEGVYGNSGQRALDDIEERISARDGGLGQLAHNRQYFDLVNETSPNALVGAEGV